ncbi:MAG: carbohydrate kinase [Prevotella sp.]|nr:carbohydrate kinase [Bacteroidaceae bacterium]MBR6981404.1 carbohydrate kinase [Prevotella sp.]
MRKIVGIGETILDIIFKNGQPRAAVPGGSVFNGIVSLGRMGENVAMITETGNDKVGDIIVDFMKANHVSTEAVCRFNNGRSALSLAWLDDNNDADYQFYKDYPKARLEVEWPVIDADDIVMMGSYFVLNPVLRDKVLEFLTYAQERGAIIYYDFNFRKSHKDDALKLYAGILENMEFADIVRGSEEDFDNMFGKTDPDKIYKSEVEFYCKNMLCTSGGGNVRLITKNFNKSYDVEKIETVSTIGAGDNFNAGVVFGLIHQGVLKSDLDNLDEATWDKIVRCGIDFAAEVCTSFNNSVSMDFASKY